MRLTYKNSTCSQSTEAAEKREWLWGAGDKREAFPEEGFEDGIKNLLGGQEDGGQARDSSISEIRGIHSELLHGSE